MDFRPAAKRSLEELFYIRAPRLAAALTSFAMRMPAGRVRCFALKRLWRAATGALNRQDIESLRIALHPDIEIRPMQSAGSPAPLDLDPVYRGPDGFVRFLEAWFAPWEDHRLEPVELIDLGGEEMLTLNYVAGQGRGSGVEMRQAEAEHWIFRRGRPVSFHQYWGWDEALAAVGISATR
ncbi:MAG: nuclear transport factor 2 family protein [Thermoleophilaceae bacterium]|nr:nuclear transport factor 2 family protein [Thermoleophilaceae bacterium]